MNRLIPVLAAASFALASTFASAQMAPGAPGKGPQMREAMKAAHEACKDKPDRRACMAEQMCAKAPDPAKCQAYAKERGERMQQRMEARQKMHEACTGKRGDELMKCLHEQRMQHHGRKPEMRG